MDKQKLCQNCKNKNNCQKIYAQLAKKENPPLTRSVFIAFVLPLVGFIASLTLFEILLGKANEVNGYQTLLSFALATASTTALILVTKAINKAFHKSKKQGLYR